MPHPVFFAAATLYLSLWFWGRGALAQTTNVICSPTAVWMDNNKIQTPCQVAAILLGQCPNPDGSIQNIQQLQNNGTYQGPNQLTVNSCRCSTVVYNLFSACALCQLGPTVSWADWSVNCNSYPVPPGQFTFPIPSSTEVPPWAFLTPDEMGGQFDPNIAKQHTNFTVPGATSPPTGINTAAVPTATNGTIIPPVTPVTPAESSKGVSVGAIVGGVIGGVAFIAAACIGVLLLIKRSRKDRIAPSVAFTDGVYGSSPPVSRQSLHTGQYSSLETPPGIDTSPYRASPEPVISNGPGFSFAPPRDASIDMSQASFPLASNGANHVVPNHPFNPYGPTGAPASLWRGEV